MRSARIPCAGRPFDGRKPSEVCNVGSASDVRLMRPARYIEIEVSGISGAGITEGLVRVREELLVLCAALEPFYGVVVTTTATIVHALAGAAGFHHRIEVRGAELAAPGSEDDRGRAVRGSILVKRVGSAIAFHRDGHPAREDSTAVAVQCRHQVNAATRHGEVGDVRCSFQIRAVDPQSRRMTRVLLTRAGLAIQRLDADAQHGAPTRRHPTSNPSKIQEVAQHAHAGGRVLQMRFV